MAWFDFLRPRLPPLEIPGLKVVETVDLSKRYDVCVSDSRHDTVYENVRILGLRSFEQESMLGDYLELEGVGGNRWMIPKYTIRWISDVGAPPEGKDLSRRRYRV